MKKQTLKISTVSLLCVLCAGLNTNAMAAASVRTLGGTGTVDGTASAGTATRSAPRAGSLRVMPTSSQPASSASAGKVVSSSKPTSTTQRLSIGKYLGGATTTATTGSSSAGSAGSGDNGNLQTRIEQLEDFLGGRISVLEGKDYMTEEEVEAAINAAQLDGADVDLTAYETASEAEAKYQPKGNYLTEHQSLADYETAAQAAEKYQPKGNYLTEHQSLADYAKSDDVAAAIAQAQLDGQVDLSAYETAAQAASKYQPKGNYLTEQSLADYATTSEMNAALADKQNTIANLAAIEAGAAAGATAVQPATLNDYAKIIAMNAALDAKQDKISDLADIRSGAAAGATAVQPAALNNYATTASLADYMTEDEVAAAINQAKLDGSDVDLSAYETAAQAAAKYQPKGNYLTEHQSLEGLATTEQLAGYATTSAMNTALAGKQDTIANLAAIEAGAAAGATAVQPSALAGYATTASLADYATTSAMNTALAGKQDSISDLADIRSGAAAGATAVQPSALDNYATTADLEDYATTASLADYATTSAMNTALSGKQDSISDLATIRSGAAAGATAVQPAALDGYATTASLSDYMTEDEVAAAIAQAKLDGSDVDLSAYETAAQAAAKYQPKGNYLTEHQSLEGLATTEQLAGYATTSAMNTALAGKQDTIANLAAIEAGAAAGATAVQPSALDNYATTADLAGYATTASLADYATTSAMNTALSGKQDSISDLADIRSGAAAGATAVQPAELDDYATTASLADYATTSAMNTALSGKQDSI
ncbi:MAG: hypothetical protein J6S74_04350, partial [Alphaproteobacteria bacterium]|nr:hypothetical protein [Alphaproteobacteria bacterium]